MDMMDPITFRVVERLVNETINEVNRSRMPASGAGAGSTSSSSSRVKSSSGGSTKKRKGSDGESRPKKQRG